MGDKIFIILMIIATLLLMRMIWKIDIRNWKLFNKKGELLYDLKRYEKKSYWLIAIYMIYGILYGYMYYEDRETYQLSCIIFWGILSVLIVARNFMHYGIYEKVIVVKTGCYARQEIKSYHWKNYVMQEQVIALMLEATPITLFKSKKSLTIEVKIAEEDKEKVEDILTGYGIKNKETRDNIANIE